MEKTKFWLRMMVVVLLFGLAVINCDNGNDNDLEKSITITGITGRSGEVYVVILKSFDLNAASVIADGEGVISDDSITVKLFSIDYYGSDGYGPPWTGSGNYIILLSFEEDWSSWIYTNGVEITMDMAINPPRYSISNSNIIPFNRFREFD